MLNYFQYLSKYLSVGPPVYFVVTDGYNYSDEKDQNSICASHGCDQDSMMVQLKWMADMSNRYNCNLYKYYKTMLILF